MKLESATWPNAPALNTGRENFVLVADQPLGVQGQDIDFLFDAQRTHSSSRTTMHNKLDELISDPLISNILPDVSNMLNVFGNACDFIANKFDLSDNVKYFSKLLGTFGTKLFLFINGTINSLEQLNRHNYLSAFGYFLDNLIAGFVPQEHTFLARGLSSGTYHLAYSLGIANGNRARFQDFRDHNLHLVTAFNKSIKRLWSPDLFKNFFNSNNSLAGILGGILSITGALMWPVIGDKAATFIRDLGGGLKSTNYINPGHILDGRKLYFFSGMLQCSAAIADFLSSIFKQSKSWLVPISLGLDGFAKYILRQSVNKGELGEI